MHARRHFGSVRLAGNSYPWEGGTGEIRCALPFLFCLEVSLDQ